MTYSILWQPSGTTYMPYFVDSQELKNFEARRPVALRDRELVRGILHEDTNEDTEFPEVKDSWLAILNDLTKPIKYESLEKLILDAATHTRTVHGCKPSKIMLEGGAKLLPGSAQIKEDLTLDTRVLERGSL